MIIRSSGTLPISSIEESIKQVKNLLQTGELTPLEAEHIIHEILKGRRRK